MFPESPLPFRIFNQNSVCIFTSLRALHSSLLKSLVSTDHTLFMYFVLTVSTVRI
jgi:hypothetical protein